LEGVEEEEEEKRRERRRKVTLRERKTYVEDIVLDCSKKA